MKNFRNIDQIFDFAIKNEEEAFHFYTQLASEQKEAAIKELFTRFAREEQAHKQKLENARKGERSGFTAKKIQTLNIGEYLVEVKPDPAMSYQDALILAMKKEKKAFLLYTHLAELTGDTSTRDLFLMLAQEEARHKLRFEIEYDNEVLLEN